MRVGAIEVETVAGFEFVGAVGVGSAEVDGVYKRAGAQLVNGKPFFVKVGDPKRCLWYCSDDFWYVADTVRHKDANQAGGYAHSLETMLVHPGRASGWNFSVNGAWTSQTDVPIREVTADVITQLECVSPVSSFRLL
jgi:hypothetical protein